MERPTLRKTAWGYMRPNEKTCKCCKGQGTMPDGTGCEDCNATGMVKKADPVSDKKEKPVWDKPAPDDDEKPGKLSPKRLARAKARAKRAGRPYPNLIDNMAVSKAGDKQGHTFRGNQYTRSKGSADREGGGQAASVPYRPDRNGGGQASSVPDRPDKDGGGRAKSSTGSSYMDSLPSTRRAKAAEQTRRLREIDRKMAERDRAAGKKNSDSDEFDEETMRAIESGELSYEEATGDKSAKESKPASSGKPKKSGLSSKDISRLGRALRKREQEVSKMCDHSGMKIGEKCKSCGGTKKLGGFAKGEKQGHAFRGNQHTKGRSTAGGAKPEKRAKRRGDDSWESNEQRKERVLEGRLNAAGYDDVAHWATENGYRQETDQIDHTTKKKYWVDQDGNEVSDKELDAAASSAVTVGGKYSGPKGHPEGLTEEMLAAGAAEQTRRLARDAKEVSAQAKRKAKPEKRAARRGTGGDVAGRAMSKTRDDLRKELLGE